MEGVIWGMYWKVAYYVDGLGVTIRWDERTTEYWWAKLLAVG